MTYLRKVLRATAAGAVLSLAACATAPTPPTAPPAPVPEVRAPDPTTYKVGNPYEIDGNWYYPAEDYTYIEEGVASWYGQDFHGKRTANGEKYDMNAVSAAHPTLPLPSVVKVTNLDNGRVLSVRINDRGPFHSKRIIDLSRRAAQLLGFYEAGTARVRVEIEAEESLVLKNLALARNSGELPQVAAVPRPTIAAAPLPPPVQSQTAAPAKASPPPQQQARANVPAVAPKPVVSIPSERPIRELFIQAGAFGEIANAHRLEQQLKDFGLTVFILPVTVNEKQVFRVRMGPLVDQTMADALLVRVKAFGYDDAQIVRD